MKLFFCCAKYVLLPLLLTSGLDAQSPAENSDGIPAGKWTHGQFDSSQIFPGTSRTYSVYVPSQYSADTPACLMVFQDGPGYAKEDGAFKVPAVFDELIQTKQMPVTVAVFVSPGTIEANREAAQSRSTRSFEYDSLGDRYVRFLVDEFLPVALAGVNVSDDPAKRALGGISSGGICAFTAAWERPDQFGKVMSHIGSYTNIRGGWAYPGLVRQSRRNPKPLKIYLQDGQDDLNNLHGNWPLGNQDLAAALNFAGYNFKFEMTEGGHTGKFAGEKLGDALRWLWSDQVSSGQENDQADDSKQDEPVPEPIAWQPHPDAVRNESVPKGTVHHMEPWKSSIFENTIRNWAIYVPAQYDGSEPAALMVFQDGHSYLDENGRWRTPIVFDNLIAQGAMPITIAVFLDPGNHIDRPLPESPWRNSNRSLEYDSLGKRYARFLLEEIIPEVKKQYQISDDPQMRAICGASSGGICSFTAAWERPDQFGKVLSTIGSFVNLRGGDVYPSLIRKTEQKPIRIYLADTSGDLDNPFGHWPTANKKMASALQYMGYDVRFDWAEGFGHNADHGGALFPDALKWLWRKETHSPVSNTKDDLKGDLTLLNLLVPGESWEVVASDLGFADGPCADADGSFYYCDMRAAEVYRIDAQDTSQKVIANESVSGIEFGPDGMLYACQGSKNRVIRIDPASGDVTEVAGDLQPNDLAVSSDGWIYITETGKGQVTRIQTNSGETNIAATGINRPNGIALSNDGGTLAVSEYGGKQAWMFRVNADGSLDAGMPIMDLRCPINDDGEFAFNQPPPYADSAQGDGMAVDKTGRYYITSSLGVQIFDPTGRPCGLLPKPNATAPLTSCILAGQDHQYLYVTNGNTIYRRRLTVD